MTFEHIEKYLAVEILMGIIKLPNVDDYWDKNPLLSNSISEKITENSYKNINSFIHPEAADSKDKEKIVNSIKLIMENSRKYFYPGTYITIDERMISYRGRAENIVYEISKPKKWGFRPYILADLNTGFTYCFNFLNDNEIDENYKDDKNGKMFNLVIEFLRCLSNYNNMKIKHVLATDGLYTSEKLLELDDIYFVRNIRKNKLKKYENLLEEIPKKTFEYIDFN